MNIRNPLFVLAPDLDHRGGGLRPLIEDSNGTIAKSCDKYVARDLVRGQGCNAKTKRPGCIEISVLSGEMGCKLGKKDLRLCTLRWQHSKHE